MSEHSFEGAPDMNGDFNHTSDPTTDKLYDYDAQHWEPIEEHEAPSEKHLEMHYTPGGAMEQEVHTELDEAARAGIIESQRSDQSAHRLDDEKELNFSNDFDEARRNAWGWDPESRREYERLSEQDNSHENDPFETGRRFEREREQERGDFER